MTTRTDAEKAQDYTAMGHSVALINAVIAGTEMADESAEERQSCVDRNVLEEQPSLEEIEFAVVNGHGIDG